MKKWLALFTVVLMVVLAACGGTGGANKPGGSSAPSPSGSVNEEPPSGDDELKPEPNAKLVVWESQEEKPFIEALGKKFEELYGVSVTVEIVPGGDQGARLAQDGPAKLAADVLTLPHDHIGSVATAGLILPNDYFEDETREASVESAIIASSYEDVLYGYPKSVETYALFYNKALVDNVPQTWDEVVAFAQTFNDVPNNRFSIMWENGVPYYSYPFIASYGGYIFGKDGTDASDIGINNEGAAKGMKIFQNLKSILPLNSGDITWDIKTQLFQEGKLALNIDGPWAVSNFRDMVEFGVVPLPAMEAGVPTRSFSGVKSYYVNSYSEFPQAARLFAHFAASKENQLLNYEMTGIIPANIEAGNDSKIVEDPIVSGFFQQFTHSDPMPSIPQMGSVWDPLAAAITSIWNEGADVQTSLDAAVSTLKDKIKTN